MVPPYDIGHVGTGVSGRNPQRNGCRRGAKKGGGAAGNVESGHLQSPPRAPVGLSGAEIRRLFWQLVVVVERTAAQILRWSQWRRWHQAWARYFHYQRRKRQVAQDVPAAEPPPQSNTLEVVWQRLAAMLPPAKRPGRPYAHDRRLVLEAIVFVMQTDCAWNRLPAQFPPWQTVYDQFQRWRTAGIWDHIWMGLEQPDSTG